MASRYRRGRTPPEPGPTAARDAVRLLADEGLAVLHVHNAETVVG
ncbi:hypothetical protein [Kitasatospora sp. NPDC059827]